MAVDSPIDVSKIKQQVTRILDTGSFKSSNILSKFLYYIVSETLGGNKDSLKEYVIATNVLNRKTDFDPQLDAIVRIHARRLRNLLDQYYEDEGMNDPIKISIPKGRYIPLFEDNQTQRPVRINGEKHLEPKILSKPIVAVMPFKDVLKTDETKVVCSVLCQDLCVALTRFEELTVVSNYSVQVALENLKDLGNLTNQLCIDYLITVSCLSENGNMRTIIEVHSVNKDQILWAESFNLENHAGDKINNYNSIIRKIMASVGGFFGFVYRDSLSQNVPDDYDHLYAAYWHNRYHKSLSEETLQESMKAVNIGLEKNPESSLMHSFKAQLLLDMKALDIQGEIDFYKTGLDLVLKAIDLDQNNQHAWEIMAWANLLGHDKKRFLKSAEKCIEVNPNNSMYFGSIGFGYECAGEYEKGLEFMSESINLDPHYFWVTNFGFCFYYLSHREFEETLLWAEKINRRGMVWDHILRACPLGHLGRKEEASEVINNLLDLRPGFPDRARIMIDSFLLDKELQKTIIEGLILAGLDIPD